SNTITVAGAVNSTTTGATTLTTTFGDVVVNAAVGNTGTTTTFTSAGKITGTGTVTGTTVILDSGTGIGFDASARLNTSAGTLAARMRNASGARLDALPPGDGPRALVAAPASGGVFVNEADGVTLASAGGVDN